MLDKRSPEEKREAAKYEVAHLLSNLAEELGVTI